MFRSIHPRLEIACVALGALVALALPAAAAAHAELETSTPGAGATVPSPFAGPIELSYSAALADGSKADLIGPDGTAIASATVDGASAAMTITLDIALAPGDYEVRWVSVADDGDLERGTIPFTVAPAPPTASPRPTEAGPTPEASQSTAPSVAPTVDGGAGSGSGDVVLPIVVALVVVGAGAAYLLTRRNRPTLPR